MAVINVMLTNNPVEIVPLTNEGCTNNQGIIIEQRNRRCCDSTTQEQCVEYLVRHMVKGCCDNCFHKDTWYCTSELIDLAP